MIVTGSKRPKAAGQLIVTTNFANSKKFYRKTPDVTTDQRQNDQSSIYVENGQKRANVRFVNVSDLNTSFSEGEKGKALGQSKSKFNAFFILEFLQLSGHRLRPGDNQVGLFYFPLEIK